MRLNRRTSRNRGPGIRAEPQRVVLGPRAGATPSAKPPVRIFVGTEPGQYRAERVLVWSVEQVRDPGRTYEIHLMKDLIGFDRRQWLTGFTNYRFAIPHLAGRRGRAIYNDVDQIYLSDPAALFDIDMGAHGYLAISPQDTAVMLIDCARMAPVWSMDLVRTERRKRIEATALAEPGLCGQLPPAWHVRDYEYVAGRAKCLHYTTIHLQPWHPFPSAFAYQASPIGHLWHDLEHSADRAGFQIFGPERPSDRYTALLGRAHEVAAARNGRNGSGGQVVRDPHGGQALDELLAASAAATVLEVTPGGEAGGTAVYQYGVRRVTRHDPLAAAAGDWPAGEFDAVICPSGLELLPDEDVPWMVEALFGRARRCVYVVVDPDPGTNGPDAHEPRPESWWSMHFAAASRRHPGLECRVVFRRRGGRLWIRDWGSRFDAPPSVWVLADDKAGHATQSVGLAMALGWPYAVKTLRFTALNRLSNRLLGASLLGVDRTRSDPLDPPWPGVVISTGRRTAPVARWLAEQSGGRARIVQLGRKGGEVAEQFDAVVTCAHFRLPPDARRIETIAPISAVTRERLAEAAARWHGRFGDAPRPHVTLVVGGTTAQHHLDPDTAERLAADVRSFAARAGGSVFAITSPRTGAAAVAGLRRGLGSGHHLHEWRPDERDNPYLGYLALADVIVVTGESESMLAEAATAGKPLYIYPLPERPLTLRSRLRRWVGAQADSRPRKKKGTIRPQQGVEYYCARLIERGYVRPLRDLEQLHESLVRLGIARRFGEPLEVGPRPVLDEIGEVATRVRTLLGVTTGERRNRDHTHTASPR